MSKNLKLSEEFSDVQFLVEDETFLKLSVVDVQNYDGTLVVMTSNEIPTTFVKLLLKKVWSGPIEVYCASALMAGSEMSFV